VDFGAVDDRSDAADQPDVHIKPPNRTPMSRDYQQSRNVAGWFATGMADPQGVKPWAAAVPSVL
jgi:hypothetical protein